MTAAELDTCNPTFAAAISTWIANRRCPFGLSDLLTELDMPNAAAAARWAESERDRQAFLDNSPTGPFPLDVHEPNKTLPPAWVWNGSFDCYAHDALGVSVPPSKYHPTARAAILWLLDNWPDDLTPCTPLAIIPQPQESRP